MDGVRGNQTQPTAQADPLFHLFVAVWLWTFAGHASSKRTDHLTWKNGAEARLRVQERMWRFVVLTAMLSDLPGIPQQLIRIVIAIWRPLRREALCCTLPRSPVDWVARKSTGKNASCGESNRCLGLAWR